MRLLSMAALLAAMPQANAGPDVSPIPINMEYFKTPPSVIQGNIEARVTKPFFMMTPLATCRF